MAQVISLHRIRSGPLNITTMKKEFLTSNTYFIRIGKIKHLKRLTSLLIYLWGRERSLFHEEKFTRHTPEFLRFASQ
jgi:hypothetical protein